ncbi:MULTISPECIES: adenosylcobinamide-GDP ribazoletransferase [unclassified Beijerinckia]|uniref:adenosylcobinamide-GDP ribazoletransferase n=1 Tax=unclassified Beijerinckia TaxID=2638183 RepID=UPI00089B5655|nr:MULTISPECIES: adenosylcobinamide-GDP ribazoletransferase [unclassified Beijerinckia]MDH7796277.1 adenosylcobinamide-GDP ribazoletransferase [Beijerinckia sp. GAS462]SEC38104.1 cobalamin-5'-phosphate synthase [Beijerinckia sp. 28-YEA-48]
MALLSDFLADLLACLRFYSRLPVPTLAVETAPHAMPDVSRMARVLPLAGIVIALPAALILICAHGLGLPATIAAGLALVALVLTTGAFHEDGLADTADGFGGGVERSRKLEIMKDSRIGTYGGAALILSLGLRWAALAALIDRSSLVAGSSLGAAGLLIAAAALSRPLGLLPLFALPPARTDGAASAAGRPTTDAFVTSLGGGAVIALLFGVSQGGVPLVLAACIVAAIGALAVTALSRAQIGGQTGDVAGAAQQLAEIGFLLAFLTQNPV